jgi:hypothetical protein
MEPLKSIGGLETKMSKYIRVLSILILLYSFLFYLVPIINQVRDFFRGYNMLKHPSFWVDIFFFLLFIFSTIGLFNFNKIARFVWLLFSAYLLFINLPEIQLLFQGNFFKFYPFSFLGCIEFFSLLGIAIFSLIIFNLKSAKIIFNGKV